MLSALDIIRIGTEVLFMKKSVSIILALLIVFGVCAAAPVTAGAAGSNNTWKTAYTKYINNVGTKTERTCFWLVDFDDSGIPELVFDSGSHMGAGTLNTYTNGRLQTTTVNYNGFKRRGNLMYTTGGSQGVLGDQIYKIENDRASEVFEGVKTALDWRNADINDPYDWNYKYKLNGSGSFTNVTYSQYMTKLNSIFSLNNYQNFTRSNSLTYSQAISAVLEYVSKPGSPALTLSNKSNGIRAEWNAVPNASKYIVYYRKANVSSWSSTQTTNTYYPLLGIKPGDTYAVQVQSVNGSVKGSYSAVKTLKYIPNLQPTLTLSNKSNGIRAEWNSAPGATKYIVYYRNSNTSSWSSVQTVNTYYPLLNLKPGYSYAVQIQPVFGSVNGLYSYVKTLSFIPQLQPSLRISNKSNGIRAEWNAVAGATKYIVYFRKNSASKWSSTQTVNTYYPLLNLKAGETYAVQIQVVFGNANGLYSSVNRLTYIPQIKPTAKLTNTFSGIRVEWNSISGASKYIIYFRNNSRTTWNSKVLTSTQYTLTGAKKGETYAVQILPIFGNVNGLYSSVYRITYSPQ